MNWNIKLTYTEGDSFNTYQTSDCIPYTWNNFELAKKAFEDIIEHYKASRNSKELDKCKDKTWYSKKEPSYEIILQLDDDLSMQPFHVFWDDYFGRLEKVEVKIESLIYEF